MVILVVFKGVFQKIFKTAFYKTSVNSSVFANQFPGSQNGHWTLFFDSERHSLKLSPVARKTGIIFYRNPTIVGTCKTGTHKHRSLESRK